MSAEPLDAAPPPAMAGSPPPARPMVVAVRRLSLIGLLLANAVLSLLTLGIYRFWARTKVRRRIWSSISLYGDSLTYTGTAKELLIGFLLALVLLVPIFGIIGIITNLLPLSLTTIIIQQFLPLGVLLFLGIVAVFYARRYILTRTQWRGIHAGQTGTLGEFFLFHLKAYGVMFLTLGLAAPWAQAKIHNYRAGITYYGTQHFSADAKPDGLWGAYLLLWLPMVIAYAAMLYLFWPMMEWSFLVQAAQEAGDPLPPPPEMGNAVLLGAVFLFMMLWGSVAGFHYYIRRLAHFTSATRLGEAAFDLPLRTREAIYIPLLALVGMLVVFGLLVGAIIGSVALIGPENRGLVISLIMIFSFFLIFLPGIGILQIAWVLVEMLKLIARRLEVSNPHSLDLILNRGQPAPRRGEGLADAIGDVGF